MGGCTPSSRFGHSNLQSFQRVSDLSPFFSHSCALFCAFLHSAKTQALSFQAIPHSLPKTTRGGVPRTSLQEGKMKLQTADSSDPTVRNGRAHQAVWLDMMEGEWPRESSSLIRSVGVAGSGAELYISVQSEGPATIPGNSSREKKK
jgi:hypothetical protein